MSARETPIAAGRRGARSRRRRRKVSTYFRRVLIEAGEDPGALELDDEDELIIALGRVLADDPHGVDTPLNDGLAMLEGLTTIEIAERSAGNLQPVPWIEAQDVADAVVFLGSDKARYVTGTELDIDAGLLTR